MYSFLVINARIKRPSEYEYFTYQGARPVEVSFRGKPIMIDKGTVFGVRKSSNGKFIRLVIGDDITRVITIDLDTAKKLARKVGPADV